MTDVKEAWAKYHSVQDAYFHVSGEAASLRTSATRKLVSYELQKFQPSIDETNKFVGLANEIISICSTRMKGLTDGGTGLRDRAEQKYVEKVAALQSARSALNEAGGDQIKLMRLHTQLCAKFDEIKKLDRMIVLSEIGISTKIDNVKFLAREVKEAVDLALAAITSYDDQAA